MNLLKLKFKNDNVLVYLFQPNKKGEWGEVEYSFTNEKASIIKFTHDEETGEINYWYARMAACKLFEYVRENNFPETALQAWY